MVYIQRKFYFPEEMYTKLSLVAKTRKTTITNVLREFVERGLQSSKNVKHAKGKTLLDIGKQAEKEHWGKGIPSDIAKNHDKYFVEAYHRLKENA